MRKMCFRYDWVIDLDIKGFFDNLHHELLMKGVERFTTEKWILMYVKRWLNVAIHRVATSIYFYKI